MARLRSLENYASPKFTYGGPAKWRAPVLVEFGEGVDAYKIGSYAACSGAEFHGGGTKPVLLSDEAFTYFGPVCPGKTRSPPRRKPN